MKFGISHMTVMLFICLNIQLGYSQSSFRGKPCDDTEHRNYSGLPNWKNYGRFLSECDSLSTTYFDAEFAEMDKVKRIEQAIKDINLKERKPIVYEEKVPGEKYAPKLLLTSIILSLMLLFLKFIEVRSFK